MKEMISAERREGDLRKQHKEFLRLGYDGHNRRSGITDKRQLTIKRTRRRWHKNLRETVEYWNDQSSSASQTEEN